MKHLGERPDYRRPRNGLLLIAAQVGFGLMLGILFGRATAPAPSLSCICPSVVKAAECRIERCEHVIEVKEYVDTLRCGRDELVLTDVDDDGFPVAQCVKVLREGE